MKKYIKYVFALLFFFCLFVKSVQASPINLLDHEHTCTERDEFSRISKENEWLGLLYLKENSKLTIHPNGTDLSQENQKFFKNSKLVEAWKKMDNLGADDALRKSPGALEVLDLKAKGQLNDIPDPSEYLDPNYISNHLAKFNEGIGRVSTRASFKKFGTLGGDNSFVLPESELRTILNETGGNVREIEKRLGMHKGDLGDNPVFGVFERESVGELKIPSGKEGGADTELWIPGGKTSGGTSEAVVDLSGNTSFNLIE